MCCFSLPPRTRLLRVVGKALTWRNRFCANDSSSYLNTACCDVATYVRGIPHQVPPITAAFLLPSRSRGTRTDFKHRQQRLHTQYFWCNIQERFMIMTIVVLDARECWVWCSGYTLTPLQRAIQRQITCYHSLKIFRFAISWYNKDKVLIRKILISININFSIVLTDIRVFGSTSAINIMKALKCRHW